MIRPVLTLFACLLSCALWAYDGTADAKGKYDGIYDRPTLFPDFKPTARFPNNMTYIVSARWPSTLEHLSNYEVAVYDQNNELRATGRSLAKDDDYCTLTIVGTEGDTFHFTVISGDPDNPTVLHTEETCEFHTNAIVGNPGIGDPFWLNTILAGDANGDGTVNTADADTVIEYFLGISDEIPNIKAADANGDGSITVADANAIIVQTMKR